MANKIESIEVAQQKKVYVKSEEVLNEMEANGQLEPFTDYYTPDDESDAPFMPVGSIFVSAIPQEDARVHLLDGSTISQTGVYKTFANLIKALYSAGQPITCSQDEFDADVSATGNCGKFVIDNDAGTIRLPRIVTFIQGLDNLTNIGSSLSAGLPNIIGSLDFSSSIGFPSSADNIDGSAITRRLSSRTSYMSSTSNTANRTHGINFDASRNNQIYGKSDTVQPPATQYPYYIVLASGYKSSKVVEMDNVLNEINNLSNRMSNLEFNQWDLVWTNSKPSSAFANQTITLDLSKYTTVSIYFKYGTGSSAYRCPVVVPINGIRFVHYEADTNVIYRAMTINSNSIVFDACSSTSNWIPLWVYAK